MQRMKVGAGVGVGVGTVDQAAKNKRWLIVGAVATLILVLAASVWGLMRQRIYAATINITVAPAVATVTIDGKEYAALGEYKIRPGEYEVTAAAEGFVSKTGRLIAVAGKTVQIAIYLEPTAENANWYLEHPEDALVMGDIKSDEAARAVEVLMEKHPILTQLPLTVDYYTEGYAKRVRYVISYVLTRENTDFVMTVTDYTGGNYADALEKLRARGVNTLDYEIQYIDATVETEWGHAG